MIIDSPTWNGNSHSFFFSNLMSSLIPPRLLRYQYNTDHHRVTPAWGTPTTRSPTPPSPTRTPPGRRCSGPPTAWRTRAWRDRGVASPHNQQSVVINVCILGINKTHDRAVTTFKHSAFRNSGHFQSWTFFHAIASLASYLSVCQSSKV